MARFFIDRPIFAWVIAILIMLAGALSASLAAIEGGGLRNREWYVTTATTPSRDPTI